MIITSKQVSIRVTWQLKTMKMKRCCDKITIDFLCPISQMDNLSVHEFLGLIYHTFNLPLDYELPMWEFIYYLKCLLECPDQPALFRILTCTTRPFCQCFYCCYWYKVVYHCMPANLNQALASLIFSHMHVLSKPFTNCIAWWTNTVENLPDWFCPEMGSNNLRNYFIPANAQPSNHNYFNISIKKLLFFKQKIKSLFICTEWVRRFNSAPGLFNFQKKDGWCKVDRLTRGPAYLHAKKKDWGGLSLYTHLL